jgi:hypothetical protein
VTEWKAKAHKLKITVPSGESYDLRLPSIAENEYLVQELELQGPAKAMSVYLDFFEQLGLPKQVAKTLDSDNFLDLITFVMNPKKGVTTSV